MAAARGTVRVRAVIDVSAEQQSIPGRLLTTMHEEQP